MKNKEIEKYINKRYERWLDYAIYHCTHAGIPDDASDVLNEVLCYLIQKPEDKLNSLFNSKKGSYTELDFFVLRMIKFNAISDTAPYRAKFKPIPKDENIDYMALEIEDLPDIENDKSDEILTKVRVVRELYSTLDLSDKARRIFEYRFFHNENFKDWSGNESTKELYDTYNKVVDLIKRKIKGEVIF